MSIGALEKVTSVAVSDRVYVTGVLNGENSYIWFIFFCPARQVDLTFSISNSSYLNIMGDYMQWIYGATLNISNQPVKSYLFNPDYIVAINMNNRTMLIKDFKESYHYRAEDEDKIMALLSGKIDYVSKETFS